MEKYPELLNLNTINKEWLVNCKVSEDRKLELRLGPPGEFHGCKDHPAHGTKRAFQHTAEIRIAEKDRSGSSSENQCQKLSCIDKTRDMVNCSPSPWSSGSTPYSNAPFSQKLSISNKLGGIAEDFSRPCNSMMAEVKCTDRKVLPTADTDNASNKRIEYSPVVGWPPVRSFRKNLATSSLSKPASESPSEKEDTARKPENSKNQLFVKINMEGIPIGRKVNLSAYNSYEELSLAIDDLFSGFLAAQRDSSATQNANKNEELAKDAGSLAGSGEYTLIYEDDEGDRVLVGDVPWHMFVSTAKRLHVLKSSELSTLRIGRNKKEKTVLDPALQI